MQYHALSLAKEGFEVDIIGYAGSNPHCDLVFNPQVCFHHMRQSPNFTAGLFYQILFYSQYINHVIFYRLQFFLGLLPIY